MATLSPRAGSGRPPETTRVVLATVVALGLSLGADALLIMAGTSAFPATRGFSHFRFYDYGTLTILGVLTAGCCWPVAARVAPAPRRLFFRLAIVVTLLLWTPDLYLLFVSHEPVKAVGVLMLMHLAIALVTYNALVRIAPVGQAGEVLEAEGVAHHERRPRKQLGERIERLVNALLALVGIELVAGVAALIAVPAGRPSGVVPTRGAAIYLVHAVLGFPLATGAVVALAWARRLGDRHLRLIAWIGIVGVALAGAGGILAISHTLRLLGMGLMFAGPMVAAFAYLIPTMDRLHEKELARLGATPDGVPALAGAARSGGDARPGGDPRLGTNAPPGWNPPPGWNAPPASAVSSTSPQRSQAMPSGGASRLETEAPHGNDGGHHPPDGDDA